MVERFHRQLKSALMAHDSTNNWTELLPIVLLGIRATVKEDLQCSPAELVYGTTLKLPELSTSNQANPPIGYPSFADRLTEQMRKLKPQQPRQQQQTSYIPKDLATAPQVFIRVDASKPPLHPPYEGPYEVQERHHKYFVINKNGRKDTVSIDRLKPAILPPAFNNNPPDNNINFTTNRATNSCSEYQTSHGRQTATYNKIWKKGSLAKETGRVPCA